jgi:hypothetical protein
VIIKALPIGWAFLLVQINIDMLTWKDNIKDLVKGLDGVELTFKKAKLKTLQELTSIAFKTQVELYIKDPNSKGREYMPVNDGDISRFTRRKSLSKKPYFSSKAYISRTGDLKDSLLNASDAAKEDLTYDNDNVGFEITPNSVKVFAMSDKFGKLERGKSAKGTKSARTTTKKTWQRVVNLFGKTFRKYFNPK